VSLLGVPDPIYRHVINYATSTGNGFALAAAWLNSRHILSQWRRLEGSFFQIWERLCRRAFW
jgi:hypothetical protein